MHRFHGNSGLGSRHGDALSYAVSAGAMSFQVDLRSDSGADTGGAVDESQFGMTVDLGDFGKIAFAHVNMKDTYAVVPAAYEAQTAAATTGDNATPAKYADGTRIMVEVAKNSGDLNDSDDAFTSGGLSTIRRDADGKYTSGTCNATDSNAENRCINVTAYSRTTTATGENGTVTTTENFYAVGRMKAGTGGRMTKDVGHKANHMAYEIGFGGLTAFVGYSQSKDNGADKKEKTTHFGARGSLGDTGMNFLVQARKVKDINGNSTSPWLLGLSRSLGGGATVYFEHGNPDKDNVSGTTNLGLQVNF